VTTEGKRWWPTFTWPEVVAYTLALVAYGGLALQYGLVAGLWVIPAIIAGSIVGHQESKGHPS
jgi:hypothetical protein